MTIHLPRIVRVWSYPKALLFLLAALLLTSALSEELYAINGEGFAVLVDSEGQEVIKQGRYESVLPLVDGELYAARPSEGDYGIITVEGEQLTEFRLQAVMVIGDAVLFRSGAFWGAMRTDGALLLPLTYTQIATGDGETFLVTDTDAYDDEPDELLVVKAGEAPVGTGIRLGAPMETFHEGRLLYLDAETSRYGYLDEEGKAVISPQYRTARDFTDGYAIVQNDDGLGCIDLNGEWAIEPVYAWLEESDGTVLGVTTEGAIDVYPVPGDGCWTVDGTGVDVWLAGGNIVLWNGQTTKIYTPEGSLLWQAIGQVQVSKGCSGQLILTFGGYGEKSVSILTEEGTVLPGQYQGLTPLTDDTYLVIACDAVTYHSEALDEEQRNVDHSTFRYGVMRADGRYICPCEALDVKCAGGGAYLVQLEEGWNLVDREGNVIWDLARSISSSPDHMRDG